MAAMLMCLFTLHAINWIPGTGQTVAPPLLERDRPFFYHTNTDDQHWYNNVNDPQNPDKWAVRYDFAAAYPTMSNAQFVINRAFVAYVDSLAPMTLKFYAHNNGITGNPLITLTNTVTYTDPVFNLHWARFDLTEPITADTIWMVVEYNTTLNGPYLPASGGGGTHSYYWNTSNPNGYFQSMQSAGYACEFLFSVQGNFNLGGGSDIELYDFQLTGNFLPRQTVYPQFTIYNNSGSEISQAWINWHIYDPINQTTTLDSIVVQDSIPAHGELVVAANNPDYAAYRYMLPNDPHQLKVTATLHVQPDVTDPMFNNTIVKYYDCFNDILPVRMLETFAYSSYNQQFWLAQDTVPFNAAGYPLADSISLNYFPWAGDPLNYQGNTNRFSWYGFTGIPVTVVGGDANLLGFANPATYTANLSSLLGDLRKQRTFIVQESANTPQITGYNMQTRVIIRNQQTHVFTGNPETSLLSQSRFYAALCQYVTLAGRPRLVFRRWAAYADTIGTPLTLGQSYLKNISCSLLDIPQPQLNTDYLLVYWIQHHSSRQIIYANKISLAEVVPNEDDTVSPTAIQPVLSPNPLRLGMPVTVSGLKSGSPVEVTIYNIRGQQVYTCTLNPLKGENRIPTSRLGSSGVYLIRLSVQDATRSFNYLHKVLILQ